VEPGTIGDIGLDHHERLMAVNYFGSLHFARAVIPAMRDNQIKGRLVFVASGAALFGIYGYAAYAPSKFAVRGLAEVLRVELFPDGISVTIAYPPDTVTPQLAYEKPRRSPETSRIVGAGGEWSADSVAKAIVRQADKRAFVATVGWKLAAVNRWHSTLGPLLMKYQDRIVASSRKPDE
jgi:3-dehydrosphinganine reductase